MAITWDKPATKTAPTAGSLATPPKGSIKWNDPYSKPALNTDVTPGVTHVGMLTVDTSPKPFGHIGNVPLFGNPVNDFKAGVDDVSNAIVGQGEYQGQSGIDRASKAVSGVAGTTMNIAADLIPGLKAVVDATGKAFSSASEALSNTPLIKGAAGNQVVRPDGGIEYVPNKLPIETPLNVTKAAGDVASLGLMALGIGKGTSDIYDSVSAKTRTYYHGADAPTAQSIKEGGFRASVDEPGYGRVNLTNDSSTAQTYAGKGGEVLQTKIKPGATIKTYQSSAEYGNAIEATGIKQAGLAEMKINDPYDVVIIKGARGAPDLVLAKPEAIVLKGTPSPLPPSVLASMRNSLTKSADEIYNIESNYAKLRDTNSYSKDGGVASRSRIAESNVLVDTVGKDGRIDPIKIDEAAKNYAEQTIAGREGVVREGLVKEGATVSIMEVKKYLEDAVKKSRLAPGDLGTALESGINKQIRGLMESADEFGNIKLEVIHDAKINTTSHINYLTPAETKTYAKAVASAYKTIVENKSKTNVKAQNAELAKYYGDIERIKALSGKTVRGGKIGKYTAQIAGQVVGGIAGQAMGPLGVVGSAVVGGEVASALRGRQMSSTFGKDTGTRAPKSAILEKAKTEAGKPAKVDLKTPDKKVGAAKGVPKTKEVSALEKKISDNVEAQKKAIKAKDFILVAKLKEIYTTLVAKLKEAIAYVKKNGNKGFARLDANVFKNDSPSTKSSRLSPAESKGKSSSDTTTPSTLTQEAQKYKSAKDFINNTIDVFHGTSDVNAKSIEQNGFKTGLGVGLSNTPGDFVFFSPRVDGAMRYVGDRLSIKNPTITSGKLTGKVLDIPGTHWDFEAFGEASKKLGVPLGKDSQGTLSMLDMEAIKKAMKEQGYGAISFKDRGANGSKAIAALPDSVLTKSQLTDFYNKVKGKEAPTAPITPKDKPAYTSATFKAAVEENVYKALAEYTHTAKGDVLEVGRTYELKDLADKRKLTQDEIQEAVGLLRKQGIETIPEPPTTKVGTYTPEGKYIQGKDGRMAGSKPQPKAPPIFKGFTDLSTKLLNDLKGRSTVSRQYVLDATNRADIKQAEKDLFRKLLQSEGPTVNVKDFADRVKTELLPLKRATVSSTKYENITLPEDLRGSVANYKEHIYESPIKTSAGDVHFSGTKMKRSALTPEETSQLKRAKEQYAFYDKNWTEALRKGKESSIKLYKGLRDEQRSTIKTLELKMQETTTPQSYFAHSRIEDTIDTSKDGSQMRGTDYHAGPRRVIEIQSDLFQKGRLEPSVMNSTRESTGQALKDIAKLEPYRNTWHERIIREEVRQAAKDGKTKLQFPTGETAMKIEGLGENADNWLMLDRGNQRLRTGDLKVGGEIARVGTQDNWIITDVLGDGKFKAVPKEFADNIHEGNKESFDISGKVDTNNPIYRFYEKEVGKYLINQYNAKKVTDPQGVEWWGVDVPKGAANEPVLAMGKPKSNLA